MCPSRTANGPRSSIPVEPDCEPLCAVWDVPSHPAPRPPRACPAGPSLPSEGQTESGTHTSPPASPASAPAPQPRPWAEWPPAPSQHVPRSRYNWVGGGGRREGHHTPKSSHRQIFPLMAMPTSKAALSARITGLKAPRVPVTQTEGSPPRRELHPARHGRPCGLPAALALGIPPDRQHEQPSRAAR